MSSERIENEQLSEELKTAAPQANISESDTVHASTEAEDDADEHEGELHEDKDYSGMGRKELLTLARVTMEGNDDVLKGYTIVSKIKNEIDRIYQEERETTKAKYLEANGTDEGFEFRDEELEQFFKLHREVRTLRKKHIEELQANREKNLKQKQDILEEIKNLIEEADKKGSWEQLKALQQRWREAGQIPQPKVEEINERYKALLDMFYDAKSVENELRELDRKKNYEAKLAICEKAEALLGMEQINEAVKQLNVLHEEYREYGPVSKEYKEEIWNRFKTVSDTLYERKRVFAEEFKKQLKENMRLKQELCVRLEAFTSFNSELIKEWNEKTKEIQGIQQEWEKIGALPKEVSKDLNKHFWQCFKTFFQNKTKFFEALEKQRAENLAAKQALCEKVEALQESTDWDAATADILSLQEDWKKIGPVVEAQREPIYARFRAACDVFFNRKRHRRDSENQEQVNNLNKKKELCKQVEALSADNTTKFDLDKITAIKEAYLAIGFVPKKDIDSILDRFTTAVGVYFDKSELTGAEKEQARLRFQAGILKKAGGSPKRLQPQETAIRTKISRLENDMAVLTNNIEFFANSKSADKMRTEFEGKIKALQAQIKELKAQLHIIKSVENE